ncbi:MAG: glycoside hydrolase family 32 protein [Bacteroidetes bacterium]|nr:glycoside hydrolase family 32 protein [Bacteroidota bacterium]
MLCIGLTLAAGLLQPAAAQTPTPQWRPVYHFTPAKNWTNDPNGPIYYKGEYLIYNQQNPFENKWGHMSWGHATSKDLLHWNRLPIAIPEKIDRTKKDTTWIFSGSAVWDKDNTSGFGKAGGPGPLVAIYTAHQPNLKKESQYIAYSNDGGHTYTNYPGNPVIDLNKHDFRDPNVFWHTPSKQWIMTVVLPAEHKAHFYGSHDLKKWTLLSEFGPQGYTSAYWECPSLIELPVKDQPGKTKWLLMVSAAGGPRGVFMQYFIGSFDGKTFTNEAPSDKVLSVDDGDCLYAAIPWNNMPDNQKVLIGWMIPGKQQTYPWTGQFSISRDMSVEKTPDGWRLLQEPAAIVRKALPIASQRKGIMLSSKGTPITEAKNNAYWLDASFGTKTASTIGFKVAQGPGGTETIIAYDKATHSVYIARPEKPKIKAELPAGTELSSLQILLDKSSLEVFVNHGEKVLTCYIYPDEKSTGVTAFAEGGDALIAHLKIWNLGTASH